VLLAGLAMAIGMAASEGDADVLPGELAGVEERVAAYFASRGLAFPPRGVTLVALKREARLELWADPGDGWNFVRSYLIRASSGGLGPKLRQGDHQVPEGVYRIAALNPASSYHLSLRMDYPNAFDRARASEEDRTRLGGDIMIHGGAVSDGCLPIGDSAIEEIFALVDRVGMANVSVIVSPLDFRRELRAPKTNGPAWLPELYASIASALEPFRLPVDDPPVPGRAMRKARAVCKPYDAVDCARRCERRDAASCGRAGLMYEGELGVAADLTRAWSFLRQACEGGDAFGCAELARLYVSDDGPRRNAARAAELAERACEVGDGHGCAYLARLCTDRILYPAARGGCGPERVRRLLDAAVAYLGADCRGWGAHDCSRLASLYVPGNPRAAFRFAAGACDGGDAGGCHALARLVEEGGDAVRAAALYARACQRGSSAACEREAAGVRRMIASAP
jgi:TPR repeat protein